MERASGGVTVRPCRRIIDFSASCHPSGVVRCQEIRCIFPRSSLVWQFPHFAITRGSVTGIPSSAANKIAQTSVPGTSARKTQVIWRRPFSLLPVVSKTGREGRDALIQINYRVLGTDTVERPHSTWVTAVRKVYHREASTHKTFSRKNNF